MKAASSFASGCAALSFVVVLAACSDDDGSADVDARVIEDAGGADLADTSASDDGATHDGAAEDASSAHDSGAVECSAPATPLAFTRHPEVAHPLDDVLRVNHVQAKATHNSYHVQSTEDQDDWRYTHVPLDEQLESQGVRGIELDVHWDARCERYEVYHLGLLDEATTCRALTDCLETVRDWSAAHPGHHPIFVQVELKDRASSYDEARLAALDADILSVFDRTWIITPDEVRGDAATLADGIADHGWPTLAEARGRLLFYLDNSEAPRDVYTHEGRDLDGRVMFADGDLDAPYAGVLILNTPSANVDAIATALERGFIVRTRADDSPASVRAGDTEETEALASGAQIVSTDFPAPVDGVDYVVEIPDGTPSRCSPATAPAECTSSMIEDPSLLAP